MESDSIAGAIRVARELSLAQHHNDALHVLDDVQAPPARTPEIELVRVHALSGLERFGTCFQILHPVLGREDLDGRDWVEARLLRARLLRKASPIVDEALEAALDAAHAAEEHGGEAGKPLAAEARCEAAYLFARKQCKKLAQEQLALALRTAPNDPFVLAAHGWVAVDLDGRAEANEHFRATLATGARGARLGRLGLAHVATLAGEFREAHAHLDAIDPLGDDDLLTRRLRARLLGAEHRFEELATLLGEIMGISPHGDWARWDAYHRANAYYHSGALPKAVSGLEQIAAAGDDTGDVGVKARRMARMLEREHARTLPRKRLQTFPSVAQLRNHCGPASCELYLRFFGVSAEQVEIARQIKSESGGTPIYRMRKVLETAGLEARRIEADLPRLKQLLDLGVPIIMEEDYSDTRHVAVAIGYDDVREVLEVQDPMTHEVRETFYEELPKLRNLSNHGALIAVPKTDTVRLAQLDAIGAVECRYIALVDEAWHAYDDQRPEDADRLCAESQAIRRDYELGWFYRFQRALKQATQAPTIEHKVALHQVRAEVAALWPDDEWPLQLGGEVLYVEGRYPEALAAFETARDRDPRDAHNWSMIADCLICMARNDEAFRSLEKALELDPAHVRANENQAYLANLRDLTGLSWILNSAARELAPANAFNHLTLARLLIKKHDLPGALAAFDAAHHLSPGREDVIVERARTLGKLGRVDDAAAFLTARIPDSPDAQALRIELADLLYTYGKHAEAAEAAKVIVAEHPDTASGHALYGASLAALGDVDAGFAALHKALAMHPTYSWVYTQMGKAQKKLGRHMEAVQCFATALGLNRQSHACEYDLGDALATAGHPGPAVRYLWEAGVNGQLAEPELERIGELMAAEDDADAFFREVAKRRDELPVWRAHARTLLEVLWAPGAAAPVLARLRDLAPDDPYAKTSRGAERMDRDLAGEPEGEILLRAAVEQTTVLEYPRRMLAERLVERGRFAEALELLAPCGPTYTPTSFRVRALLGLDRLDDAQHAIAAFAARYTVPGRACVGALMLSYRAARRRWDFAEALRLSELISRENNERDDDGRLDHWEQEKFECLCRLGQTERALRFGEQQAVDAPSLSRLAYEALSADCLELARELARRALRLDPDDAPSLHVTARLTEIDGNTTEAIRLWRRVGTLDPAWHVVHEHIARVSLGLGELARATEEAEAAILTGGHMCGWAFGVRAQARMCAGDRAGALADVERAWAITLPELREHDLHDVWSLRARLAGDAPEASRLQQLYLRDGAPISAADRARVARVAEAH